MQNYNKSIFIPESFKKKAFENGWKSGRDDVILDALLEPFKIFETLKGAFKIDERNYADFLRENILEKK